MVLQIGQQLQGGVYTIERELGRGRFAITYLARRSDGNRRAIKALNSQVLQGLEAGKPGTQQQLEDQFWKEALALSKCEGLPHIVQMDEPFRDNGAIYLPMEYMNGNTLADLPQLPLSEDLAVTYIRQIGESLMAVHQRNLLHCNVQPENIFLRAPGGVQEVVLTNFRLVLTFDTPWATTQNVAGETVDGYSAPELYTRDRPLGKYTHIACMGLLTSCITFS
jgi:eukaryotic-like serine/threonine-protein kinase